MLLRALRLFTSDEFLWPSAVHQIRFVDSIRPETVSRPHRQHTGRRLWASVCVPKHSPTFGGSVHVSLWLARLKNTLKSTHTHISTLCVRVCVCELLENKGLCEEKPFVCVKLLTRRPVSVCVYLCVSECVSRCVFLSAAWPTLCKNIHCNRAESRCKSANIRCQPSC